MKPVMIDFADGRGAWRWDWRMAGTRAFVVMAVASVLIGGAALQRAAAIRQEQEQIASALARLHASRQSEAAAQKSRTRASSEDDALLRQAAQQRALPWESIFRAFEAAPSARLESFEPDVARGVVKVRANAGDVGEAQQYLGKLQDSQVFKRVSLLRHELPPEGAGVNFHYEAVLAGPYRLAEERKP